MTKIMAEAAKAAGGLALVCEVIPAALAREIMSLAGSRKEGGLGISELRLRACRPSSVVLGGVNVGLMHRASEEDLARTLSAVCGGSLYAHRDTITEGYVCFLGGVRVGVIGDARYEGGRMIGVSEVDSLIFRIPTGKCSFADKVYGWWCERGGPNLLIASAPASGKTTLLRALAGYMASGRMARRTVVIDERREFIKEDYKDGTVDILRGYSRATGLELAIRTMSPEVILVDEISDSADAAALLKARGAGVSVVATAHAESVGDLYMREGLASLMRSGMFRHFVGIKREGREFSFTCEEAECVLSAV